MRRMLFALALLLAACGAPFDDGPSSERPPIEDEKIPDGLDPVTDPDPDPVTDPDPDPEPVTDPDPDPDPSPDPEPVPDPADALVFTAFPALHGSGPTTLGSALEELVNHTPQGQVSYYQDSDMVTWAHETSHAIHAHLRNSLAGSDTNGFYVLEDRAVLVREPPIRKSEIGPFVPASLREFRYSTYVTGQSAWDDTPLYLFDEWNAYVNGAAAALVSFDEDEWQGGWRDQSGNVEFVGYALATLAAVESLAPEFLETEPNFVAFVAFNARRAMDLRETFSVMPDFQSATQDELAEALVNAPDVEALRASARRLLGAAYCEEVFGF